VPLLTDKNFAIIQRDFPKIIGNAKSCLEGIGEQGAGRKERQSITVLRYLVWFDRVV
jgi:hypothetical protein